MSDYTTLRAELLTAERAHLQESERLAALRRKLPLQKTKREYTFKNEAGESVELAGLFLDTTKPLIVIHNMGKCPLCAMWADTYNAAVAHLLPSANVALTSETEMASLQELKRTRGWTNLRLHECVGKDFNSDMGIQFPSNEQGPGISVFVLVNGKVHHHYSTVLFGQCQPVDENPVGPGRGIDPYSPVWQLLDLLPKGRGEFDPKFSYDA